MVRACQRGALKEISFCGASNNLQGKWDVQELCLECLGGDEFSYEHVVILILNELNMLRRICHEISKSLESKLEGFIVRDLICAN